MAKSTTFDDNSRKNKNAEIRTKPLDITVRFTLDYAKSVYVIKSKLIEPFVIVNN